MSDFIKREDAIMALRLEYPMMPMFKSLREEWAIRTEGFRKAEEVIMMLPSADRPQGEWKNYKDEHYCTNCGEVVIGDWYTEDEWYDFCPNCGAQMKGADDE